MSDVTYFLDPQFASPWAERVGKLILNFGVIELESYLWLVELSTLPEPEFSDKAFTARAKDIIRFSKTRAFSEAWKEETIRTWMETLKIAKFRNRIAHSPLNFGWTGTPAGEPDYIGVVDLKGHEGGQTTLASISDMEGTIDHLVFIAARLAQLRAEWCELRDRAR